MPRAASQTYASHPMIRYVRSLPGDFLLRREVAETLGCSHAEISYLGRAGGPEGLGPTHTAKYGAVTLNLYTPERVERIREHLRRESPGAPRRGRPRMWSADEVDRRRKERARMYAYRYRARKYREAGDDDYADVLDKRADAISRRLGRGSERRRKSKRRKAAHGLATSANGAAAVIVESAGNGRERNGGPR